MNESMLIVGGVVLAGVAAGAAWYVTSRQNAPKSPQTPVKGDMGIMPVKTGSNGLYVPGATQQAPFQDASGQALALELAKQRAEAAEREALAKEAAKQTAIAELKSTAGAVENAQMISLTKIQGLEQDESGLAGMIALVREEAHRSCDQKYNWFTDPFGNCKVQADKEAADPAVPWSGYNRWKTEKARRLAPEQANLARLEEQFKGLTSTLKTQYGIDYLPQAFAAHQYAAANSGR